MDKDERAAWGPLIKQARNNLGLDQQELADLAGTTRNTVGNIERGKTVPQSDVLDRLLEALELRPRRLDGDVESFLALIAPLLQRVPVSERSTLMPDIVAMVTRRISRSA